MLCIHFYNEKKVEILMEMPKKSRLFLTEQEARGPGAQLT
jgi:hypothetical protein